jgi:hypothetical protein
VIHPKNMKTSASAKPPTRANVHALIDVIQARVETSTKGRVGFAVTAIYCQINEGISPAVTATLHYNDFRFGRRWVEFPPRKGTAVVRRLLSEETANHLERQMSRLKAKPGDLIHCYVPSRVRRQRKKDGTPLPEEPSNWNEAIDSEVRLAGFDPQKFTAEKLKWIWWDANPNLRQYELRATTVAEFILRWAKTHQQEALLRLFYEQNGVLRPSWAYPNYDAAPTPSPDTGWQVSQALP